MAVNQQARPLSIQPFARRQPRDGSHTLSAGEAIANRLDPFHWVGTTSSVSVGTSGWSSTTPADRRSHLPPQPRLGSAPTVQTRHAMATPRPTPFIYTIASWQSPIASKPPPRPRRTSDDARLERHRKYAHPMI